VLETRLEPGIDNYFCKVIDTVSSLRKLLVNVSRETDHAFKYVLYCLFQCTVPWISKLI